MRTQNPSCHPARVTLASTALSSARAVPNLGSVLGTSTQCPNLTRTLSIGSRGTDVVQLQNFLISQNHLAAGNSTGYFGSFDRISSQEIPVQGDEHLLRFREFKRLRCGRSEDAATIKTVCSGQAISPTVSPIAFVPPLLHQHHQAQCAPANLSNAPMARM